MKINKKYVASFFLGVCISAISTASEKVNDYSEATNRYSYNSTIGANFEVLSHLLKIAVKPTRILDFRHYDAMSILKFSKA